MGFSTVGASLIIFAGLLFVTSVTANAFFEAQREYSDAIEQERTREDVRRWTSVALIDGGHGGDTLYLNLTNTGDTVLDTTQIGLLVDGEWSTDTITSTTIDGRVTELWAPGQALRLEADQATEPQRAYLVLGTGQGVLWTP